MSSIVIDSSALLAVVKNEPGADVVIPVLDDSAISLVNWTEVVSYLTDRAVAEPEVRSWLARYACERVPYNEDQAWLAGLLRPLTRDRGLSLGDRACLALGQTLGLPVLTADQKWRDLDIGVEIRMIR